MCWTLRTTSGGNPIGITGLAVMSRRGWRTWARGVRPVGISTTSSERKLSLQRRRQVNLRPAGLDGLFHAGQARPGLTPRRLNSRTVRVHSEGNDEPVGSRIEPTSEVSHVIRRASTRMGICLGLALASQLLDASPAVAQQEPPRSITRLGGATRFTAPVNDISALATTMGRATIRDDLATVFEQAGMPALAMEAQRKLAVGEVTVATLPQGTTIQWMALRRQGPNVVRNLRWDGDAPLQGFEFTVDDLQQTYHFFVPAVCGNVSLISQEPSREARRLAQMEQDAAAREAAMQATAAAQEQARMAQEQYEAAEQARLAAEQALADYQAALERDLRVRPFVAGFAALEDVGGADSPDLAPDCRRAGSVGQTSGATQRCLNPGFSKRIGNSRRTSGTSRWRVHARRRTACGTACWWMAGSTPPNVAERNLKADESGEAIHHPLLSVLCGEFRDGHYTTGDTIQ